MNLEDRLSRPRQYLYNTQSPPDHAPPEEVVDYLVMLGRECADLSPWEVRQYVTQPLCQQIIAAECRQHTPINTKRWL